jgi:hypothetical protein
MTASGVSIHSVTSSPRPSAQHVSEAEGPADETNARLVEKYLFEVGSCCLFSLFLPRPSLDQHRYDTSRLATPPLLSHNGLIATSHIRHAQVLPVFGLFYGVEATLALL